MKRITLAFVLLSACAHSKRNLAVDFVTSEEPDAKCVEYHRQAGEKKLDSAKCSLPDKRRIFVRVDTEVTKIDCINCQAPEPPKPDQVVPPAPAPAPAPVVVPPKK